MTNKKFQRCAIYTRKSTEHGLELEFNSLDAQRERVSGLGLDERFQRLWSFYLCYCEAGFIEGRVSDVQVLVSNRR